MPCSAAQRLAARERRLLVLTLSGVGMDERGGRDWTGRRWELPPFARLLVLAPPSRTPMSIVGRCECVCDDDFPPFLEIALATGGQRTAGVGGDGGQDMEEGGDETLTQGEGRSLGDRSMARLV
jgi:hypothetical protein